MADNVNAHDDNVQHGIDDNPSGDPGKGALMGGIGGAVVGALAGGPLGAVIGGIAGAVSSGAAVAAVDAVDNDNTVSGIGSGATGDIGVGGAGLATGAMAGTGTNNMSNINPMPGNLAPELREDTTSANYTTRPYGSYQGRQITRSEFDTLAEADRLKVQLLKEELHVGKESRQAGEVEISKRVVEEQVQVPVTLEREEVVIHRHAVGAEGGTLAAGQTIGDETITVPLREEFAQVTKDVRVAEEIEIEKRTIAEQKTVADTVRHEEIDTDAIKTQGNVRVEGDTTGRM